MKECSKSIPRRLSDSNFLRNYFKGKGIDIGGKPDPLSLYQEFFPLMQSVLTWDWEHGDAQFLETVSDNLFDFVHSSHCLEHLTDPFLGLKNWLRVVREGGYLVITIPDEDLYEQGVFPSSFNKDHKWTFTIYKSSSWSSRSINVLDMVRKLGSSVEVIKIEQLNSSFRFNLPRFDQTLTPVGESGIEIILRKRSKVEIDAGIGMDRKQKQPISEVLLHYNQYMNDMRRMKEGNESDPPFTTDSPL